MMNTAINIKITDTPYQLTPRAYTHLDVPVYTRGRTLTAWLFGQKRGSWVQIRRPETVDLWIGGHASLERGGGGRSDGIAVCGRKLKK